MHSHLEVIAVFAEPITLEMAVVNPLKVALVLRDLTLLWQFLPQASDNSSAQPTADKSDCDTTRPLSHTNEGDFCLVSFAVATSKSVIMCMVYHRWTVVHQC